MKRLLLCVAFVLAFSASLSAGPVTVAWDPGGASDGFELWLWEATWTNHSDPTTAFKTGAEPAEKFDIPAFVSQTDVIIPPGTWILTLKAYNRGVPEHLKEYSLESDPLPIVVPVTPPTPGNLRLIQIIAAIAGGILGLILLLTKVFKRS
jgi:hypothetical protein